MWEEGQNSQGKPYLKLKEEAFLSAQIPEQTRSYINERLAELHIDQQINGNKEISLNDGNSSLKDLIEKIKIENPALLSSLDLVNNQFILDRSLATFHKLAFLIKNPLSSYNINKDNQEYLNQIKGKIEIGKNSGFSLLF